MPFKEWTIPLGNGFEILCRRTTLQGRFTSFAVILIFEGRNVTRYDTAHGIVHRDVLGSNSGLLKKEWHENVPRREAFRYAVQDLREHFEHYYDFFLKH